MKTFSKSLTIVSTLIAVSLTFNLMAQQNKNFYLLDSFNVEQLSPQDKSLADDILNRYHATKLDTVKLRFLDTLSFYCSDSKIRERYRLYSIRMATRLLDENKNLKQKEVYFLKQAKANALNSVGLACTEKGDFDKAANYYKMALKSFEEIGDNEGISNTKQNIGYMYLVQEQVDKAIDYLEANLPLLLKVNNQDGLAAAYNCLAGAYQYKGNIEKTSDYFLNALKIYEKQKDSANIAVVLANIGAAYYQTKNYEATLKYAHQALEINERIGDKMGVIHALHSMALVYTNQNDFEKALESNLKSLKISEEIGDKRGVARTYANIALAYRGLKKYDKAEESFLKSIALAEEVNNLKTLSSNLKNLGSLYLLQDKFNKAEQYGLKSLDVANKINMIDIKLHAIELLEQVYKKQTKWSDAYKMRVEASVLRDSIVNRKNMEALMKASYEYEFDKKEAELNAQAERENLIAEQRSERQRIIIGSVITVLVLVLIFALLLFNRLRTTRAQKEIIDKKNKENELLLSEIHHRVKNNLQVISSLLSMQERNIDNEKALSAIIESKERVRSIELIHKLLYRENYFSGVEMYEYLRTLTGGLVDSFNLVMDKDVEIHLDFKPITIDVDTAVPLGLILNELIVNSFKYAKSGTEKLKLEIVLHEEGDHLKLSLKDNGNGKKSTVENSNSFGLRIIKALVKQLHGIIEISEQNGLIFNITLVPLKAVL